jgi:hypothetical protein
MQKFKKFLVPGAIGLAVIVIAAAGFYFIKGKAKVLSAQDAANEAIDYINNYMLQQGYTATLGNVTEENGLYKVEFDISGNKYTSYVSKDGKYFFPTGYDLTNSAGSTTEETGSETATETEKSDNPDLKLFVMSYCPYGLQAEKMYLPVYNLLKDKADMAIYFVSYAMHGEKEVKENLRQYCIQKEQADKYYDYLSCFVVSGDYESCLTQAKINSSALSSCESKTDEEYQVTAGYNDKSTWLSGTYPQFKIDADLNTQYGVQGSPTIVLNGQTVNVSPRSPEKLKEVLCAAFNNAPEECSQTLSSDAASVSFGSGTTTSASSGNCQ